MKQLLCSVVLLLSLNACTHQFSPSTNTNENDDGSIGFSIITADANNQALNVMFMIPSNDIKDHKNNLEIWVLYNKFPEPYLGEETILQFKVIGENNVEKTISLTSVAQSQAVIDELIKEQEKHPQLVKLGKAFLIKKDDYKSLSNAKEIYYSLTGNAVNVQGQFSDKVLNDIRKNERKLLNAEAYEPDRRTVEESLLEMKEAFINSIPSDLEKLERSKTRSDLEKNFGQKFTSNKVNPATGSIEETVTVKIDDKISGPLVVGFNQQNKIIYVRNAYNTSQIRWRE